MTLIEQRKNTRVRARSATLPITALTERHHTIIALLVHGINEKRMTTNQIAEHLAVKPGWIHSLLTEPIFKTELDRAFHAKAIARVPEALDRQVELMHSGNDSVALGATKAIIDCWRDGLSPADSPAAAIVNTQVNVNQVNVGDSALEAARRLAFALEKAARATAIEPRLTDGRISDTDAVGDDNKGSTCS